MARACVSEMLQYETLLMKQLQRQQNRAEFCDTVLQCQGVSVPVHSCVLSAFSPWLCGALSSMPALSAGQRWLIELQRVEACTLLSLVSLLYSGQLDGNRQDVLSAAEMLGIQIPQRCTDEGIRNGCVNAEQQKQSLSQGAVRQHNAEMQQSGRENEKIRESGTQTLCRTVGDEQETQTDHIYSDPQQGVHMKDHGTCSAPRQGQLNPTGAADGTMMLLGTRVSPEKKSSSCDALAVGPETGYHIVSEPACVSQFYPPEFAYDQPPTSVTPYPLAPSTYMELGNIQSEERGVSGGVYDIMEGFKQFEGNIPGFISCFLDQAHSQGASKPGRRGRGRGTRGEGVVRRARVRTRGDGTVGGRGSGRGRQRQGRIERWGWAPRLPWRGQGGGRVGRKLDIRPTGKQPFVLTRRRRGRGALLEVGEGRGRGRQRKRGRGGAHAISEGQDATPCLRSLRDQPLCPLAASPCSSSLLRTVCPPSAPPVSTQPMDMFLDDIMAGLSFLPSDNTENHSSQHGFVNSSVPSIPSASKTTYPSMGSSLKPTDVSQQQPEGELCGILDHFLNTFEQHDLGVEEQTSNIQPQNSTATRGGAQVNRDPSNGSWSNTSTQLQPVNPRSVHCPSSTPNPQPQPVRSSPANTPLAQTPLRPWCRASKDKLEVVEKEFENQRVTRSQSMNPRLRMTLTRLQSPKRKHGPKKSIGTPALTEKESVRIRRRHKWRKRSRSRVGRGADVTPCLRSLRDQPLCPLAAPPCSSSLLRTVCPPSAPPVSTQPMDMFLDDIMAGLSFLPSDNTENRSSQHGFVNSSVPSIPSASKTTYPSMGSSLKPTDVSQQQPEGELCGILDHFLNTFEQHDLGVEEQTSNIQPQNSTATRGGAQVNRDPSNGSWSNTSTQLQPVNSRSIHCPSSTPNPQPQPVRSSPANTPLAQTPLRPWCRASKDKLEVVEKEFENQRVTRSQSMNPRLRMTLTRLQSPKSKHGAKKSIGTPALTEKESVRIRRRHKWRKRTRSRVGKGAVSNTEAGDSKITRTWSTDDTENNAAPSLSKEKHLETCVYEKRFKTNGHGEGSHAETEIAASSLTSQTTVKNSVGNAYIKMASSAFEKMRMLLEEQRERQQQQLRPEDYERVCKENKVRSLEVQESLSGPEDHHSGKSTEVNAAGCGMEGTEGTFCAETEAQEEESRTGEVRCKQKSEQSIAAGLEQVMTNKCSTTSQVDLLPNADRVESTRGEESDHNNNEPMLSNAASPLNTFGECRTSKDVLHAPHDDQDRTPSASRNMVKINTEFTLDLDERTSPTPAKRFCHELIPSSKPKTHMPESAVSSEEDEEVDVLEVSDPTSEPIIVPVVFCELSTEEEEEEEEEEDVDVLGVESD